MTWLIKLIMFVCAVPTALLLFAVGFPKDPSKRKMIFGVRDNEKFHEGDTPAKVKAITDSCRKDALAITAAVCLMSVILLILPSSGVTILAWMLLVFAVFLIAVPFGKGNTELKNLKKELGITKSGTVYADLTNTSVVHALKIPRLILPNAVALAGTAAAVMIDLGVIRVTDIACEKYALTMMSLPLLFIAVLLVPIGIMMDNTRNMVISKDSNVNANYNRAKKKTWADLLTALSWANALFLIGFIFLLMFVNSEAVIAGGLLAYTLIIMAAAVIGAVNQKAIEKRYERDTDLALQDDDDFWVLGMFYYNPNDTRLNVEKRFGYGSTVNIAHPAGKVITAASAILLIASLIFLVYMTAAGQFDPPAVNIP